MTDNQPSFSSVLNEELIELAFQTEMAKANQPLIDRLISEAKQELIAAVRTLAMECIGEDTLPSEHYPYLGEKGQEGSYAEMVLTPQAKAKNQLRQQQREKLDQLLQPPHQSGGEE